MGMKPRKRKRPTLAEIRARAVWADNEWSRRLLSDESSAYYAGMADGLYWVLKEEYLCIEMP